jgi:hypothetical protein
MSEQKVALSSLVGQAWVSGRVECNRWGAVETFKNVTRRAVGGVTRLQESGGGLR